MQRIPWWRLSVICEHDCVLIFLPVHQAHIVLFLFFLLGFPSSWRGFHILIKKTSFSSPTNMRSHNLPPSGTSVLLTHYLVSTPFQGSASLLAHRPVSVFDTICNGSSLPSADISLFKLFLEVFKTCLLGRGFHTLIKNASFSSPIDVGSHNPLPSGPSVLLGHCLVSTPFHGLASSLALSFGVWLWYHL